MEDYDHPVYVLYSSSVIGSLYIFSKFTSDRLPSETHG
jgi:hypothetical protein